jgi:hypothetical protein
LHAVWPTRSWYWPFAHGVQSTLAPGVLLQVPAAQGAHVAPSGAYTPTAHDAVATQLAAVMGRQSPLEYVSYVHVAVAPAGHGQANAPLSR